MGERLYRILLRAYPVEIRTRQGDDAWLTFRDRLRAARRQAGGVAVVKLWIVEALGAIHHGIGARVGSRRTKDLFSKQRENLMRTFFYDARHALRTFGKNPSFTFVVVITLALGIGANTAIFSVVNGVLLKPLPFAESERLVSIEGRFVPESGFDFEFFSLSPPEFFDYQKQNRTMEGVAAFQTGGMTLTREGADPARLAVAFVSHNLVSVLRTPPALGRAFQGTEDIPNGPNVAVLGHGLWQTLYGAETDALGKTLVLNGLPSRLWE